MSRIVRLVWDGRSDPRTMLLIHPRKEKRAPSATQPNHLTGSEMGRKNWVASVGMTGEGGAIQAPHPPHKEVGVPFSPRPNQLTGRGAGRESCGAFVRMARVMSPLSNVTLPTD